MSNQDTIETSQAFKNLEADLTMIEANRLNKAAGMPGLSAHEIAVLEAARNRIANEAASIRRGDA